MREIVVVSGKGGTGKTSITAAFTKLSKKSVICDADVDAADLHLLLQPQVQQTTEFMGGGIAVINTDRCVECGRCRELCRFGAISEDYVVDDISCEGCGVCVDLCPEQAIDFPTKKCGEWFRSTTKNGPMVHARLGIAEENSGKLVSLVRKQAKDLAEDEGLNLILTDGPPGIGCPVIAAIGGATVLVMVVEPTLSGIHDMERLVELAVHFRVPGMVLVNKFDLNLEMTAQIERNAKERNLQLLGRISFDPVFVQAMVEGKSVIEYDSGADVSRQIATVWQKIVESSFLNPLGIKDFSKVII
ncbi:4Fe-4S binding protein [Desulfopila sp. IMCC35008]|uniref:4Fe-4S binding protein n=1 Tax=Desulfopila sp. IMCC35008 TaxID=2653858 RepID=UPI0013CFBE42|nr:4Fe-4S binding protein [Desulfopila sp. IMCC35008]